MIAATTKEPGNSNSLVLAVLTVAILGLIYRLEDLERRLVRHVPEPEPKPELETEEQL